MKRLIIVLAGILILVSSAAIAGKLTPGLESQIRGYDDDEMIKVLVVMRDQADIQSLNWDLYKAKATKADRHRIILQELQQTASRSQGALLTNLNSRKAVGDIRGFTPHWLVNSVVVSGTVGAIRELAARQDVAVIEADLVVELIKPVDSRDPKTRDLIDAGKGVGVAPGLRAINADRVWYELGIDGSGIIVGGMDTGVDGTHVALASRWQGNFTEPGWAWQDVAGLGHTTPVDTHGHGSHTMGTITGLAQGDTIGVCPGAHWIASNAIIDESSEFDNHVIDALEWFSDPDGNPATVDDMPEVVQNSWGVNESFTGYIDCDSRWWDAIDNCEATGVVLIWSAGNEGSGSETVRSPADRATSPTNCFSVGSTLYSPPYTISSFSSRGPSGCGGDYAMKPEVVAPGSDIYSVSVGGGYTTMSGTSMAGPHVAGVVGLMRAANPDVDVITIKQVLMDTAVDLGIAGEDQDYGHGIIDAYEAVLAVVDGFGFIEGIVTDSGTSLPIADVTVTVVGESRGATTDANGFYRMGFAEGDYTLEYSVFGYLFATQVVTVVADGVVNGDITMDPAPTVRFYGIVYDPLGTPIEGALISVLDTPLTPVASGATGYYEINVPSGGTYDIKASCAGYGSVVWSGLLSADTENDFHLPAQTAEDFETGDFTQFPWVRSGDADWIVDGTAPWEGSYCGRAGAIGGNSSSTLELTLNLQAAGEVNFYYKVDSETGYDFLRFSVDGTQPAEWSGSVAWALHTVNLGAGLHVLTWTYSKDGSIDSGADTAWLDFIEFPTTATMPQPLAAWAPAALDVELEMDVVAVEQIVLSNDGDADLVWTAHVVGAEVQEPVKYEELVLPKGVADPRPGRAPVMGSGGPDTFGYSWKDSDESGGPIFDWVEINGVGTAISMSDDDNEGPFALGFDFLYYGEIRSEVLVCSNGWVSFDATTSAYANQGIPTDSTPNNLLALFWDDLNPGAAGTVYYYADTANERFIVEFDGVVHYDSSDALTFQVIINADGGILFQYKTVLDVAGCTVGIENADGSDGLEVCFNASCLHDDLAILFNIVPVVTWLGIDPSMGTIPGSGSTNIDATFDTSFLELGVYTASIVVETNDTASPTATIPVGLEVVDGMAAAGEVPQAMRLIGAVPNPFNPATNIVFSLPRDGHVDLAVYDVKGRLVRSLLAGPCAAGEFQVRWNGADDSGRSVASGTYYVRLDASGGTDVAAVALVR